MSQPSMTPEQERLRIVIVGHVDHGKSTLIGRLFYDTDSLPDGKVESIRKACEAEGMEFEYAFLLDALLEEQAQNITIDTTQIQFRTPGRNYVIIDAPGHKEFLKNMITGAASADAAILLIDANEGVQEQSRRHGVLLSLLGIRQVMVAVNKMDLVNFSQERFEEVTSTYRSFLAELGVEAGLFIPVSAKLGHNISNRSDAMGWYSGPTILEALGQFRSQPPRDAGPLRFVLQDIYRFDERRILAGRVESGTLRVGQEMVFWPNRKRSKIKSIEAWGTATPPTEVGAGLSAAITLEEQIFAERGQVGADPSEPMIEAREIPAKVFWIHNDPLVMDRPVTLRLATQEIEARLVKINRVMDSSSLDISSQARSDIRRNEVADVVVRVRKPLACDNADRVPELGRFVLVHEGRIGGGGIITGASYPTTAAKEVTSANITWSAGRVTREVRTQRMGHRGAVLWLTGLSGSGKSTVATAAEAELFSRGISAFVLDGDNLRYGLCSDLGFSDADRAENIRRAGEVARLMAESGIVVISSLISPFRQQRRRVRDICTSAGIGFAEVYVSASLAVCEQRDPKKLYQRARKGEIPGFTGIDSPYEAPEAPDLVLPTGSVGVADAVGLLVAKALQLSHPDDPTAEEVEPSSLI